MVPVRAVSRSCPEFAPDRFVTLRELSTEPNVLIEEIEFVDEHEIRDREEFETMCLFAGILELLIEFLARIMAFDTTLAKESVKLAG